MMHTIHGTIVDGSKKATTLGFPTVNLAYKSVHQPEAGLPAGTGGLQAGIYAGSLLYDGEEYRGAVCLAPDGKLEIHCFTQVPLKHIKEASIALYQKISEYAAGDDEAMKAKIAADIEKAKQFFADPKRASQDT